MRSAFHNLPLIITLFLLVLLFLFLMHGECDLQFAVAVLHGEGGLQVAVLLLHLHSLLLNQLYSLLLHSQDLLEQEVLPERVGLPLKLLLEVAERKTYPL